MLLPDNIAGMILAAPGAVEFSATGDKDSKGRTLFRKDMLRVGSYTHPTRGWTLDVDRPFLDGLATNFRQMKALGIDVPVTQDHSKKAESACGELVGMEVQGGTLYGIHAMDDSALGLMTKSGIGTSVEINREYVTTGRRKLGAALTANSIVQHPVVPGQGDFVKIAASIGGESSVDIDAPVLILSQSKTKKTPEDDAMKSLILLLNACLNLSIDAEADDKAVAEAVQGHVDEAVKAKDEDHAKEIKEKELSITTLTASLAEAKPIEMSREIKAMCTDSLNTRLDALEAKSKLSPEARKDLQASLASDLMLSVAEGADRPGYSKILDAIDLNDPVKLGEQTASQALDLGRQTPDAKETQEDVNKRQDALVEDGFGLKKVEAKV